MTTVKPDGPIPCGFMIVGEAPAREEVAKGKGFVGPSGRILWPALRRLAMLERDDCYVTNLCKRQLDNSETGEAKLSPEEFATCREQLMLEMMDVQPGFILAVGALAARAVMEIGGHEYIKMEVHNGMSYPMRGSDCYVVPCWHPAAALYGDTGKDPLAWMGDAMAHFTLSNRIAKTPHIPGYSHRVEVPGDLGVVAVDTEGTVDDPICLTWAGPDSRHYVWPEEVPRFWASLRNSMVVFHNAPWDWAVLEKMGVKDPYLQPFQDTMELAYLHQPMPQGLKDLSLRFFGVEMRTWEQVVMPYYDEVVLAMAAGIVDANTTVITHTKSGKLRKKPQIIVADSAKPLKRALENPKLARERIGDFPPPSLRFTPKDEMLEYATLDPYMTFKLWEVLNADDAA